MTLTIPSTHIQPLAALRVIAPDVRFVIIGAAALGHHVTLDRTTADVDLAVVVEPEDIASLVAPLGWRRDEHVPIRWHGPDGFRADLLPATPELVLRGSLSLDGGDCEMSLVGFDLALDDAIEIELAGTGATVQVASLAAIVVLKIVAWLDRRDRTKDLHDIATALERGLDEDDLRRWDDAHALHHVDLTFEEQSPYFVGLSVGAIGRAQHFEHVDRFLGLLSSEDDRWAAAMAREAGYAWQGVERVRSALEVFGRGVAAGRGAKRDALEEDP